jgi:predicted Zn finger-like uncharacterized protein
MLQKTPRPIPMDVRCERCHTEYEVEDSSVSDLGTEVQCSDCGHLFTVRRPSPPSASLPVPSDSDAEGGWTILTAMGLARNLRDLTQLHQWIIERRVTRNDKISRDGQTWQTLGSMAELVPFFDIVDSAERARAAGMAPPSPPLAPLQPPVLTMPAPVAEARPADGTALAGPDQASPLVPASLASDPLGALPQAADIGETEMIRAKRSGRGRFFKVAITSAVAAGLGYGGIRWQRHYLRPAVISSSGATDETQGQLPAATPPPAALPASASPPAVSPISVPASVGNPASDDDNDAEHAHGPVVEPLDPAPAPDPQSLADKGPLAAKGSLAARAYAALSRRHYTLAIALFRKELAKSPINGTALFGLAEAYRGAGQKQLAAYAYRRYIAIMPFGPDVGSARHQIRSLEGRVRR